MSNPPQIRRADKLMPEERCQETIAHAYCGRLASVGPDGWPYVVPLLYVWMNGEIWVHNTRARGHLRTNVDHDSRVSFEVDDPGEVFAYGRFECDTSVAYRSIVAFGRIRVVEEWDQKKAFFDAFMEKYSDPDWDRPRGFYPRLDQVTVYAISVERMTGKETPLPTVQNRWPAIDHTKSPQAVPEAVARSTLAADPLQAASRSSAATITLRLATPDDLNTLVEKASAYHEFEGIKSDGNKLRESLTPLIGASPSGAIWLVEMSGLVIGYIAFAFGYSIEFGGRDAFIDELYIDPDYRGNGIGTEVLRMVKLEAIGLGVRALHLEVGLGNKRAQRAYASVGFERRDRFFLMSLQL